jgi:Tol biopolymer transport system component
MNEDQQMIIRSSANLHRTSQDPFLRPLSHLNVREDVMKKVTTKRVWLGAIGLAVIVSASSVAAKNWDDWSTPVSIEALPGSSTAVNTPAVDGCASHSPDGLTLVFNSNRAGNFDLYFATRSSTDEGFGPPVRLPEPVNSSANDSCATIDNGHRLYFSSDRDDPAYDIYVSKLGPKGWSEPENLGPNINTPGWLDETAAFYEDSDGNQVMLFSSRQTGGSGDGNIYQSVNGGPKSLVAGGPNSSASDNRPSVTRDGLTIFFDSTRSGGLGGPDIYYATRSNTSEPFGPAIHLGGLSSSVFDARPYISKDGSFLTFASQRPGGESAAPDMYYATRNKITGQ